MSYNSGQVKEDAISGESDLIDLTALKDISRNLRKDIEVRSEQGQREYQIVVELVIDYSVV